MTRSERLEWLVSPRALAAASSVALHLLLFVLIVFSGGRRDGIHDSETPITQLVLLHSRLADRRDGIKSPPREPTLPTLDQPTQLNADANQPRSLPVEDPPAEPVEPAAVEKAILATSPEPVAAEDPPALNAIRTVVMAQAEKTELMARLARLAEELAKNPRSRVTWEENGKQYQAALVMERAKNGVEFDRVIAEVSAEDRGKQLTTHIKLKRLAFSHYTQMIDRWDPSIQLHDDEIVGRFHVNSRFNLLDDGHTNPKFLGKVTTTASSFSSQTAGRLREADIFRGGVETRAGHIDMPAQLQPFEWAPRDEIAQVYELPNDTRIKFFPDGSYTWIDLTTDAARYRNEPSNQPVYFIAKGAATLHVKGVICGKVLIYSPQKIVIEGNLVYAHDPRKTPDSGDFLGLVSDRTVEIAPAFVTGPGDIDINAAIYAGRRFVVKDIDRARTATLRIYGSLAAGTVSATEPRFATKIDYDSRFEEHRPPGFPSTSQFAAEDWDGSWTETPEQASGDGL